MQFTYFFIVQELYVHDLAVKLVFCWRVWSWRSSQMCQHTSLNKQNIKFSHRSRSTTRQLISLRHPALAMI